MVYVFHRSLECWHRVPPTLRGRCSKDRLHQQREALLERGDADVNDIAENGERNLGGDMAIDASDQRRAVLRSAAMMWRRRGARPGFSMSPTMTSLDDGGLLREMARGIHRIRDLVRPDQ